MRTAKWIALTVTAAVLVVLVIMFLEVVPFSAAIEGTKSGDPEGFDYRSAICKGRAWMTAISIPFVAYAVAVVLSIRRSQHRMFLWASIWMLGLLSSLPAMGLLLQQARSQSPIKQVHWAILLTAIISVIVVCARLLRTRSGRDRVASTL